MMADCGVVFRWVIQVIKSAAEGNREGVLKKSIEMKFLTGYESKVSNAGNTRDSLSISLLSLATLTNTLHCQTEVSKIQFRSNTSCQFPSNTGDVTSLIYHSIAYCASADSELAESKLIQFDMWHTGFSIVVTI